MKGIKVQPAYENIIQELFLCKCHKDFHHTRELEECHNVKEDEPKEEDDSRKLNITESEGFREVQGPKLSITTPNYSNPMKKTKINIGTLENPKLAIIGDYWDEEIIT